MNFMEAVELMKQGKNVKRKLWGGSCKLGKYGMFIFENTEVLVEFSITDFEAEDWEEHIEPNKTLSDKIQKGRISYNYGAKPEFIESKEVKQFIKDLKKEISSSATHYEDVYNIIDELAGKELVD